MLCIQQISLKFNDSLVTEFTKCWTCLDSIHVTQTWAANPVSRLLFSQGRELSPEVDSKIEKIERSSIYLVPCPKTRSAITCTFLIGSLTCPCKLLILWKLHNLSRQPNSSQFLELKGFPNPYLYCCHSNASHFLIIILVLFTVDIDERLSESDSEQESKNQ